MAIVAVAFPLFLYILGTLSGQAIGNTCLGNPTLPMCSAAIASYKKGCSRLLSPHVAKSPFDLSLSLFLCNQAWLAVVMRLSSKSWRANPYFASLMEARGFMVMARAPLCKLFAMARNHQHRAFVSCCSMWRGSHA